LYHFIKPFLLLLDAEKAHHLTLSIFRWSLKIPLLKNWVRKYVQPPTLPKPFICMGIHFKNTIGLAAGFDKNAEHINEMAMLGFGYVEIGTVTPLAQKGNDKPRLFRLPKDEALINRMGFNNKGLEAVVNNLKKIEVDIVIGGNLGKNKATPNEHAADDYIKGFQALYPYVDYFVVNVSSPNTPNLRALQDKAPLQNILQKLLQLNEQKAYPKPILLKIAPDLNTAQLDDIIDIVTQLNLPGIIATNTTIERTGLQTSSTKIEQIGNGGLSGKPIYKKANTVLSYLRNNLPENLVIIGVGGIYDITSAKEKLHLGANLIQVYSGLVYYGPTLIKDILKELNKNEKEYSVRS